MGRFKGLFTAILNGVFLAVSASLLLRAFQGEKTWGEALLGIGVYSIIDGIVRGTPKAIEEGLRNWKSNLVFFAMCCAGIVLFSILGDQAQWTKQEKMYASLLVLALFLVGYIRLITKQKGINPKP